MKKGEGTGFVKKQAESFAGKSAPVPPGMAQRTVVCSYYYYYCYYYYYYYYYYHYYYYYYYY